MRRHDSLIPLTHDHHHVLRHARLMKQAISWSDDGRKAQVEEFIAFFEDEGVTHFREEEERIFPLVIARPEARELLGRAMIEHLELHALVQTLRDQIQSGDPEASTMDRLARTLEGHVRLEEKTIFPLIERLVPDPALESVSLGSGSAG